MADSRTAPTVVRCCHRLAGDRHYNVSDGRASAKWWVMQTLPKEPLLRIVRPSAAEGSCRPAQGFTVPENYRAYVERTDEKAQLAALLSQSYLKNDLPVRPGDRGGRILDLGCGLGTNTSLLLNLFTEHEVHAIDVSRRFVDYASRNLRPADNLVLERVAFEDYRRSGFDFILCSHVLQYIDTNVDQFIAKIVGSLKPGGEAWIVLQEEVGINQLVQSARPVIENPNRHLQNWFVHSYVRELTFGRSDYVTATKFESHFRAPDMAQLSSNDTAFLNFILLDRFDAKNHKLRERLFDAVAKNSSGGWIRHDVGITRIRRRG